MTATQTDFSTLTGTYAIDPMHTRIGFSARHAMVTKVRGSFDEFEGTAQIDGADPAKSTAHVVLQVASIDTRNEQRDGHLRTNDFLDMDTYPTITFDSTAITHVGGKNFEVVGNLTIKDVTKQVTVPLEFDGPVVDPFGFTRVGFEGSTTINRKDWGINWNTALDGGGVLVSEKVTLEFEISAVKQS